MSYHTYHPDAEVSISIEEPPHLFPLQLDIAQWCGYRPGTSYDEQLSPQHSSHFPTAPPSPTTPNSTHGPSPHIPFDNLNLGFHTSSTSPQGLAQSNDILTGSYDPSATALAGAFLADTGDKFDPNLNLSYPYSVDMEQLPPLGLFAFDGADPNDGLLFGLSNSATPIEPNTYHNVPISSQEPAQVPTPLYINYQPIQPIGHLQVPPQPSIGRRHSDHVMEGIAQFRAQVSSSVDPRDAFGQGDDYIISVPESQQGAGVGRSKTFSGRGSNSGGASLNRKSQSLSMRGRRTALSSRTSSRNSSISRPSPYPTTAPLPEHPELDVSDFPTPPSPHSVLIREEFLELFNQVKSGIELDKEKMEHVEHLLRLHSDDVLNFQPLVSSAEPTAVALAAQRRRRLPSKNENRKMFTCFLCARELTEKHNFVRHFLAHYGIKRFKCDACGEGSTTSSDLARHRSKCDRVVANASALDQPLHCTQTFSNG